jgi:AcrR family transcriptional regulator
LRVRHAIDRRVQRTHSLLRDALVTLIHEKSYDSIAVKEILERANVGRSAFYTHFRDKDALLASGIDDVLQATPARSLPPSARRFANALWFSFPIFQYIRQRDHLTHSKMPAKGRAIVHEHLRQLLVHRLTDALKAESRRPGAGIYKVPPDLFVQYVVGTFILVLDWWVECGSSLSPLEADDLFLSLVVPTLTAAVDGEQNLE